ncbi:MAG: mucoidy inhibitor MuiA family protein [Bauldia sp.]
MSRMSLGAGLMLGVSVVVLAATGAVADELRATSKIDSVTAYPTGATIVRTAAVALPEGATTVLLDDLPSELDANSLKVEGTGDHAFAIASVDTRVVPADEATDPARVALTRQIEEIDDGIAAIGDRLDALDGRKRFLEQLIESAPTGFGKALADGAGDIADWNTAAATIGDGLAAVADAVRAAHLEQRDLSRQRDVLSKSLADLPAPRDHMAVRIALAADAAAKGTLTVSYHTASARWLPTYDAQLATGEAGAEPSLAIVRRAEVTQATGEDWDGVRLTLSTAPVEGGTAVPQLDPYLVSLFDPDSYSAPSEAAPAPPATAVARDAARMEFRAGGLAANIADAPAKVIEAAADFGDFRAEYRVPGLVSVESDKGARSLQIATEHLTPHLGVRAAPSVSETAYLQAKFTAADGAPLVAGKVALFRDGTFVGNGTMPFTSAGAEVDLGFGVDDRVHIVRATLDHQSGEAGIPIIASRKTDTRTYKTTVENLHSRPMEITILDRMPYAENEDIAVKRLNASTKPTDEDVDDKRGILAWTYTYAPGEKRDVVNAYEVSWPANQSLVSLD